MKLRFPWNMALVQCSWVFFELSRCCFQEPQPVYPPLRRWQRAHDERFTLSSAISQIISRHSPTSPNLICLREDYSTRSIHLIKGVSLIFEDPYCIIWQMIVTMQKWFMIFISLIQDCQYFAVQLSREGYASSRFWTHTSELRNQ